MDTLPEHREHLLPCVKLTMGEQLVNEEARCASVQVVEGQNGVDHHAIGWQVLP